MLSNSLIKRASFRPSPLPSNSKTTKNLLQLLFNIMVMIDRRLIRRHIEIDSRAKLVPIKRGKFIEQEPPGSRLLNQEVGDQHRAWRDADLPTQ